METNSEHSFCGEIPSQFRKNTADPNKIPTPSSPKKHVSPATRRRVTYCQKRS